MTHATEMNALRAECERLRGENATFRNAQKACEDCDAPTTADLERLREQNTRLREALREQVIKHWNLDPGGQWESCELCDEEWRTGTPERHAPGCLADLGV